MFGKYPEDDNVSIVSVGSIVSSTSRLFGFSTLDIIDPEPINAPAEPLEEIQPSSSYVKHIEPEESNITIETNNENSESNLKSQIFIGTVYNQNLIY